MKPHNRKLLSDNTPCTALSTLSPLQSTFEGSSPPSKPGSPLAPNNSPQPFDSNMALTVLVIVIALFFMGFFSMYLRRLSDDSANEYSRRRRLRQHGGPPSSSSSSSSSSLPSDHRPAARSNPSRGVDPITIQALPVYSYCGDAEYQIDCAICISEFEEREIVKVIPYCNHVFHRECIDTWLKSHVTCPVCRSTQLFEVKSAGLGVEKESCDQCVSESGGGGSTVENRDAYIEVRVGSFSFGVRRNSSCSNLSGRAMLQRTFSF